MDEGKKTVLLGGNPLCHNPRIFKEAEALAARGQEVEILINADSDSPLSCELPPFVELEVTYAEPGVKGDTANSPKKRVEVESGAKIMVPLFIEQGQKIRIDTRTRDYVERVK